MSIANKTRKPHSAPVDGLVPPVSPWFWNWFTWYSQGYLRKRFHALRILHDAIPQVDADWPLIVYLNHASWYDPLVGLYLARRYFPQRTHFAPMDAAALAKYRFLARVGFYGVERGTRRGVANFLRQSEAITSRQNTAIWITPQGKFVDVRERPLQFQPGLAHLAERLPRVAVLPLAIEYVYWNESKPEILVAFGDPLYCERGMEPPLLEASLVSVQDWLADAAIARDPHAFATLIDGRAGVGGVYDLWRRGCAALRGQRFDVRHEAHRR